MQDGFFGGALQEAQNNLTGFLQNVAPPMPNVSFHPTDTSWGVPNFSPSDNNWSIPNFSTGPSTSVFDVPRFNPTNPMGTSDQGYQFSPGMSAAQQERQRQAKTQNAPGAAVEIPTDSPYYTAAVDAAKAAGYDPGWFTAQIARESHFDPNRVSPKGARGIAQIVPQYHPDVNTNDPVASLNYAAQLMAQYSKKYGGDIRWALAAYNMGVGATDRLYEQTNGQFNASLLPSETQSYIRDILAAHANAGVRSTPGNTTTPNPPATAPTGTQAVWGGYNPQTLVPNQYTEGLASGYDRETALAICGPAAAVAFTRAYGRPPETLKDATEAARIQGLWDVATGMHGPASEVALMQYLGVPAHAEAVDWNKVKSEVQAGRPVALSTGKHYYVATGYDESTGKFEFGNSAGVIIASGGNTQYTPAGLGTLGMGLPTTAIYMDK